MELKLSRWGQEDEGAAIERGPLVYARPIKARELKYLHVTGQDTADFPSYFLYPTSTWNYAIGVNEENIETTVKVIANKEFAAGYGWDLATTPVRLQVLCAKSPTGHSIPTRPMAAIDPATTPGHFEDVLIGAEDADDLFHFGWLPIFGSEIVLIVGETIRAGEHWVCDFCAIGR